jgi:hypothetical protein
MMMSRIKQIREELSNLQIGDNLLLETPFFDTQEYLLRIAEASENLLKETISNRVSKTLDLSELRKALEGD